MKSTITFRPYSSTPKPWVVNKKNLYHKLYINVDTKTKGIVLIFTWWYCTKTTLKFSFLHGGRGPAAFKILRRIRQTSHTFLCRSFRHRLKNVIHWDWPIIVWERAELHVFWIGQLQHMCSEMGQIIIILSDWHRTVWKRVEMHVAN